MKRDPVNALASLKSGGGSASEEVVLGSGASGAAARKPAPDEGATAFASAEGTPVDNQASVAENAINATSTENNEPSQEVNYIDPTKPIVYKDKDGVEQRLTWEEYQAQQLHYSEYMRRLSEVDRREKEVAKTTEERDAEFREAAYVRDIAARDPFMGVYLQRLMQGASKEEAFRAAQAASGIQVQEAEREPEPPTDDTDSPEYAKWYHGTYIPHLVQKEAARIAADIAKKETDPIRSKLSEYEKKEKELNGMQDARRKRAEANTAVLNTFDDVAYQLKGVQFSRMSPEEQRAFGVNLTAAFQSEIGIDIARQDVLETQEIRPDQVKHAVRVALERMPQPAPVKPRVPADKPHTAAPNGAGSAYNQGTQPIASRFMPPQVRALSELKPSK